MGFWKNLFGGNSEDSTKSILSSKSSSEKLFNNKYRKTNTKVLEEQNRKEIIYVEVDRPDGDGQCSDNECPCGIQGVRITRGNGYLWVTKDFVKFRSDCITQAEVETKIEKMLKDASHRNVILNIDHGIVGPILICEEGALMRNIDMKIARSDAIKWWKTGLVPLRSTPFVNVKKSTEKHSKMKSKKDKKPIDFEEATRLQDMEASVYLELAMKLQEEGLESRDRDKIIESFVAYTSVISMENVSSKLKAGALLKRTALYYEMNQIDKIFEDLRKILSMPDVPSDIRELAQKMIASCPNLAKPK